MSRTHCSFCGAEVSPKALACPGCGSDRDTGWASEEAQNEAAFAPFDDEDYDAVVADLEGDARPLSRRDRILIAVAVLTLIAFIVAYVV